MDAKKTARLAHEHGGWVGRTIEELTARVEVLEKENRELKEERDERRRLASELLGGDPLTPEELAGDYVLRGVPKPAADRQSASQGPQEARSATEAPTLVEGVRRAAQKGLPVMPAQILALCDALEHRQRMHAILLCERRAEDAAMEELREGVGSFIDKLKADIGAWWWIVNDLEQPGCLDCGNAACDRARAALVATHPGAPLLSLLGYARAWAGAKDQEEIERCAGELIAAIARCSS